MTRTRPLYAGLLMWALLGFSSAVVQADEGMSPAVGKPLQQAAAFLKSGKYREALAKIQEADAVGSKTANESFAIERMRESASLGSGNTAQAVRSFEALTATGRLAGSEKIADLEGIVGAYYRANDFANAAIWANRYVKEGGTDPRITSLGPTLRYKSGDYAGVVKELRPRVEADEKAGRASSEQTLQLLAACYQNLKDDNGSYYVMERMVAHYPQKANWTNVLNHVSHTPGFSERLALDLLRLKFATDNMRTENDPKETEQRYMEMAQLSLQDGFNTEAKKVVDQAYANHIFGDGPEAARQKRLVDLITKRLADDAKVLPQAEKDAAAAADGTASINLGFNYITAGQVQKGLPLVDAGLKKGNFKREDDAKLHAGMAYALAAQKAKAVQTLKTVQGADGTQALAHLWTYRAQQ
jgi:hypothetical protein